MLYMIIFWLSIITATVMFYLFKRVKPAQILTLVSLGAIIMAIGTKDPIFAQYGIPTEFEWVVGLVVGLITLWLYFLHPLEGRMGLSEKHIAILDTKITHIESDIREIKSDLSSLRLDFTTMKMDISFIKGLLIGKKKRSVN